MSVPVHKRSENKLQALKDTMAMTSYTIEMCENPKIFPVKCRWSLCTKLMNICLDSIIKIRQANKIKTDTVEKATKRVNLQFEVLQNFEALWALMTVAFEVYSIPSDKIDNWTQLMLTAEDKTTAWYKFDMNNLKKLKK